jgi:hypothetical protein
MHSIATDDVKNLSIFFAGGTKCPSPVRYIIEQVFNLPGEFSIDKIQDPSVLKLLLTVI